MLDTITPFWLKHGLVSHLKNAGFALQRCRPTYDRLYVQTVQYYAMLVDWDHFFATCNCKSIPPHSNKKREQDEERRCWWVYMCKCVVYRNVLTTRLKTRMYPTKNFLCDLLLLSPQKITTHNVFYTLILNDLIFRSIHHRYANYLYWRKNKVFTTTQFVWSWSHKDDNKIRIYK